MTSIELTLDEAKEVMESAVSLAGDGTSFENFPIQMQVQALNGVINVVRGLQALGYRIYRPMEIVKEG